MIGNLPLHWHHSLGRQLFSLTLKITIDFPCQCNGFRCCRIAIGHHKPSPWWLTTITSEIPITKTSLVWWHCKFQVDYGSWASILRSLVSRCQPEEKTLTWRDICALKKGLIEDFYAWYVKECGARGEWSLCHRITLHDQLCTLDDIMKLVWIRAKFCWATGQFTVGCQCGQYPHWRSSRLRGRLRALNHAALVE